MNNKKLETYEFTKEEQYQFFIEEKLFMVKEEMVRKEYYIQKKKGMIFIDYGEECWIITGTQLWRKRFNQHTALRAGVNAYLLPREEFDKLNESKNTLLANIVNAANNPLSVLMGMLLCYIIIINPLFGFISDHQKEIELESKIRIAYYSGAFAVFLTGMLLRILNDFFKERKIKKIAIGKKRFKMLTRNPGQIIFKYLVIGFIIFVVPMEPEAPGIFIVLGGIFGGILLYIYNESVLFPHCGMETEEDLFYVTCLYDENKYFKIKIIDTDLLQSSYYRAKMKENGEYMTLEECQIDYETDKKNNKLKNKRLEYKSFMGAYQ